MYTVEVSRVRRVKRLERSGVGPVNLERLARKGIQIVDLLAANVIAAAVEERVGWLATAAGRQERHREQTHRSNQSAHGVVIPDVRRKSRPST
jgi:adenylosuccinate synthase